MAAERVAAEVKLDICDQRDLAEGLIAHPRVATIEVVAE
jgi:hypothetical protein